MSHLIKFLIFFAMHLASAYIINNVEFLKDLID